MKKNSIALILLVLAIIGCAERKNLSPFPSISPETREEMNRPVNCSTASRDIQVLESEKASVLKQSLAGVRSVFPFAAAAGILMGDYSDRVQVATGQYNRDLENKISQIRNTCGIR